MTKSPFDPNRSVILYPFNHMFEQLSLFEPEIQDNPQYFHSNLRESGFEYQDVDIGDITFKAGQGESIHRWYRLTPSYSPILVRYILKQFQVTPDHLVFDPFSGRGTTSIECQKQGIKSLGLEINPVLQQVGNKSLYWNISYLDLLDNYLTEIAELIKKYHGRSLEEVIDVFKTRLPIIHNVFRWWKEEILKELIICREVMLKDNYNQVYNYLWIALNKACLDCANIHRNHPTITFDDHHNRNINVFYEIKINLKAIREDLIKLNQKQYNFSQLGEINLGDATTNLELKIPNKINFIITSPPYPNRYSYVHQTRPQLHFMELLDNIRQATEIDLQAVGGTWGRATSILQKKLIDIPSEIKPFLTYYDELKDKSILMCNYATKYFIDMWRHIQLIKEIKGSNFRGVYVVGNSRLSGVEIFTEAILGKIFESEQFEVEKIITFRKRGGKKQLYETGVCIRG